MRKCTGCGYLLFGDGDTCNHCGAVLPRVAAGVGAAMASPPASAAPASPAAPPASAPLAPDPLPQPSWRTSLPSTPPPAFAAPPTPQVQEFWRPPTVPVTQVKKKKSRVGTAFMLLVIIVIGGGAYRFYTGQRDKLPAGTSTYVKGDGVDYTAPDRSYSVRLPEKPQVMAQPYTVQSVTVNLNAALVSREEYEVGAASVQLPTRVPAGQTDELLDSALNGGVSNVDGKLVSKKHIERGGVPTVDAKFKAPDGYSAHIQVMLSGTRLYMLFVHAKHGTDRLFNTLNDSFVPAV